MPEKEDESDVSEEPSAEEETARRKLEKRLQAEGGIRAPKRGAQQRRRGGDSDFLPQVGQNADFSKPAIVMTQAGKTIHRWDRGGESHWIEGHSRFIEGKKYRLLEIRRTAGVNYMIVEEAK